MMCVCVMQCLNDYTLIIEYREQANNLLNSDLMSNMSTSQRDTITLIRVLSSVPAPCNRQTHEHITSLCPTDINNI